MRVDVDQDVPWFERFKRSMDRKVSGRKHKKCMGQKAKDRHKAHLQRAADFKKAKGANYKKAVAAYWAGEREAYPCKSDFGLED